MEKLPIINLALKTGMKEFVVDKNPMMNSIISNPSKSSTKVLARILHLILMGEFEDEITGKIALVA